MARRKTKYAHVTGSLPKIPLIEPARRDIVNAVKAEILAAKAEPVSSLFDDVVAQPSHQEKLAESIAAMQDCVQQIIALEKARTEGRHYASEYILAYAEVRDIKEKFKEWLGNIQLLLDTYLELLLERMDLEKLEGIRTAAGYFSKSEEPYGVVKDKDAFREWCIYHDYGNQLQLWPSKMNAIVKERLLHGEPTPDGVEVYAVTTVSLRGTGDGSGEEG